jgi:hypothetical protein
MSDKKTYVNVITYPHTLQHAMDDDSHMRMTDSEMRAMSKFLKMPRPTNQPSHTPFAPVDKILKAYLTHSERADD